MLFIVKWKPLREYVYKGRFVFNILVLKEKNEDVGFNESSVQAMWKRIRMGEQ